MAEDKERDKRAWEVIKDYLIYKRPHFSEDEILLAIEHFDFLFGTTNE